MQVYVVSYRYDSEIPTGSILGVYMTKSKAVRRAESYIRKIYKNYTIRRFTKKAVVCSIKSESEGLHVSVEKFKVIR